MIYFREVQNNFVEILCFAKFLKWFFAATQSPIHFRMELIGFQKSQQQTKLTNCSLIKRQCTRNKNDTCKGRVWCKHLPLWGLSWWGWWGWRRSRAPQSSTSSLAQKLADNSYTVQYIQGYWLEQSSAPRSSTSSLAQKLADNSFTGSLIGTWSCTPIKHFFANPETSG